jgi:GH35 family endo-1,4-beta-xylanase
MNRERSFTSSVRWLAVLFLIGLVVSLSVGQQTARAQTVPSGQRLRALAGNFLIGYASANDFWNLSDTNSYQTVARREFNILTPENQMKWDTIHPQQNTFNFAPGDRHVQFAQANGMRVHGHNLVWHSQNPGWLTGTNWSVSQLTSILNNHIDTVVGHYRGQIAIWDVVNEAFQDNGQPRQGGESVWFRTFGNTSYIELAFRRARQDDPSAALVYNDFNIEAVNAKSNAVFAMAQDFKNRGVPIDGIGFQMHLTSGGIDLNSLASNMQRFANLGLNIYITEMDVRYPTPISAANRTAQATIYQNVLDRCLRQTACKAFQIWGFTDKYSWVPNTFSGQGDALIFDANYNAKPAYFSLQSRLAGTGGGGGVTTVNDSVTGTGNNQFNYSGSWGSDSTSCSTCFNSDNHYSNTTNNTYQVAFNGTRIALFTSRGSNNGIAAIRIDNGAETNVDLFSTVTNVGNQLVFTSPTLTSGAHTLRVRVTGTRNASSSNFFVSADRVDITP